VNPQEILPSPHHRYGSLLPPRLANPSSSASALGLPAGRACPGRKGVLGVKSLGPMDGTDLIGFSVVFLALIGKGAGDDLLVRSHTTSLWLSYDPIHGVALGMAV